VDYCLAGDNGTAAIWNGQPDLDLNGDGRLDAIGGRGRQPPPGTNVVLQGASRPA
jgi:hypothetical protein